MFNTSSEFCKGTGVGLPLLEELQFDFTRVILKEKAQVEHPSTESHPTETSRWGGGGRLLCREKKKKAREKQSEAGAPQRNYYSKQLSNPCPSRPLLAATAKCRPSRTIPSRAQGRVQGQKGKKIPLVPLCLP